MKLIMTEYKDSYFGKSFMMIGSTLPKCYNCSYCRANDSIRKSYSVLPAEMNPAFKNVPMAVNIFYGDLMLQIDNTVEILEKLEANNHTGPVIIITKGDLRKFPTDRKFNLDLHFGLSTFGCDSPYDGSTMKRFENNIMLKSIKSMQERIGPALLLA